MRKTLTTLILLICCHQLMAQFDVQKTNEFIETNTDHNKIDSIAKVLNLKGGDQVEVLTTFKINEKGEIEVLSAKGPHKLFEQEAVKLLNDVPAFEIPEDNNTVRPMAFRLPIVFSIETEKQKKRRLKKEQRESEKENKQD